MRAYTEVHVHDVPPSVIAALARVTELQEFGGTIWVNFTGDDDTTRVSFYKGAPEAESDDAGAWDDDRIGA